MRALPICWLFMALSLPAAAHAASPLRSYWNSDRTAILSDVEVTRPDGTRVIEQVLGGSVDGIAMIQMPLYSASATRTFEFVPSRNTDQQRLHWAGACIFVTPDSAGSKDISGDNETAALSAALDAWNKSTASCSYQKYMLMPAEPLEVALDGKNTVKFRETTWCRPAHGDTPEKCYNAGATAITTLFFIDKAGRPDDGTILDADIEINSVDYAMAVGCETRCQTGSTKSRVEDLQNTLTHELGHMLGLDHTCWDGAPAPAPLDDQGQAAPFCTEANLPNSVVEATMYNFQFEREVKKRTPEPDDVDGVCTAYPLASDPKLCEPVTVDYSGGCCAVAGTAERRRGRDGAALLGGLLFGAALLVRARACSRSRRR